MWNIKRARAETPTRGTNLVLYGYFYFHPLLRVLTSLFFFFLCFFTLMTSTVSRRLHPGSRVEVHEVISVRFLSKESIVCLYLCINRFDYANCQRTLLPGLRSPSMNSNRPSMSKNTCNNSSAKTTKMSDGSLISPKGSIAKYGSMSIFGM